MKGWDKLLWGVEMRSKSCKPEGMLIGDAWHSVRTRHYDGEPCRCLLFNTRRQAREWCRSATSKHAKHSSDWRFYPRRVRETITEAR